MKQKLLFIARLIFIGISTSAKQIDENTARLIGQNSLASRSNSQNLKNAINLQMV